MIQRSTSITIKATITDMIRAYLKGLQVRGPYHQRQSRSLGQRDRFLRSFVYKGRLVPKGCGSPFPFLDERVSVRLPFGIPTTYSALKSGVPCYFTQKLGLLTVSDYINASMDSNCTTATSRACQNYNYLAIDTSWWLGTAVNEETNSEVFMVNSNGTVESTSASNYAYIRPVVYLNSRVLYASGKGTEENPYKIR